MLQFKTIDLEKQAEQAIRFRRDSFKVSFGDASDFDEDDYLQWLKEMVNDYPEGFVMVEEGGELIGQLELSLREYDGESIGYVNLYYLILEKRGNGRGEELHTYTKDFFKSRNVTEFHLRVAPSNTAAIKFYRKIGMEEIGSEVDGKVIRMKGSLEE